MGHNMAAKTKKAKTSSSSSSSKAKTAQKASPKTASKLTKASPAKGTSKAPKAIPAKATAKAAPQKAAVKATAKVAAPAKAAAKKPEPKEATPSKTKTTKSGLTQEISSKAKSTKSKASDERRSQAAALIEAAMEEEEAEEDDDDEFDPEAFLAASGGKGLINSHVMRKERVDLNLPIRYRLMRGPLVFNSILLNLSKSGLCIETKEKLALKTVLRIEIPLPHTSELFAIQAEAIWTEKSPDSPSGKNAIYHVGMNFLPMSLAKKTVINNFIQQRRDEIVMAKIGLDRFGESVPVAGLD